MLRASRSCAIAVPVILAVLAFGCKETEQPTEKGPTFVRVLDRMGQATVEPSPILADLIAASRSADSPLKDVLYPLVDDGIPVPGPPVVAKLMIGGSSRSILLAPPPTTVSVPMEIPRKGVLELAIASVAVPGLQAGGVEYRVSAVVDGGRERTLYEATLEPAAPDSAAWQDASVDLRPVAGKRVTLVFSTTSRQGEGSALAAWACPTICNLRAAEPRPNVILVSVDTLRADHLGCYGYGKDTSPFIDSLAGKGLRFERALSPATWTLPAHMSALTGDYPSRHGVDRPAEVLDGRWITMAEVLRRAGYATAAVTEGVLVSAQWGFHKGFDYYAERSDSAWERKAEKTVDETLAWLGKNHRYPFFLFVHTYEPHAPLVPPPPYDTMFDPDYKGPYDGKNIDALNSPALRPHLTKRDIDHIVSLYDGEIRYTDECLRRLFAELEASGLLRNTYVIFMSDHGEEFNERGRLAEHGKTLFNEVLRVPLFFTGPGIPPGVEGRATASLVDLPPTILDLVGVPSSQVMDGRSLKALVMGKGRSPGEDPPLYAELNRDIGQDLKSVVHGGFKLVKDLKTGDAILYDAALLGPEGAGLEGPAAEQARGLEGVLERFMDEQVPGLVAMFVGAGGEHKAQLAILANAPFVNAGKLDPTADTVYGLRDGRTVLLSELKTEGTGDSATLYFNIEPPGASLQVMLHIDGKPATPEAILLGRAAAPAGGLPVMLRADSEDLAGGPGPELVAGRKNPAVFLWRKATRHATASTATPDEETLRTLRALGYVQ